MIKFLVLIILALLVCDAVYEPIKAYVVVIDGKRHRVRSTLLPDWSVQLQYDLSRLQPGHHRIKVKAISVDGIRSTYSRVIKLDITEDRELSSGCKYKTNLKVTRNYKVWKDGLLK